MIDFGQQLDDRLLGAPGQGLGKVEDGVHTVQQGTVPMLFQAAPHTFNRIVLAVIGWIVSQLNGEVVLVREVGESGHKLSAPAVILGSIIQVDEQGLDVGEALMDCGPELFQAIGDAITGQARGGHVQKQLSLLRQIDAKGCHFVFWLKIVIHRFDGHPGLATTGKCTYRDCGFGINRDTQDALCAGCLGMCLL